MTLTSSLVLVVVGLALLSLGADLLVSGAARLSERLGISKLVVGLTVVAFGTSAPELFVSVASALRGEPDVALGNVVGSNLFNVLAILGLAALVTPLAVDARLVRLDIPLMVAASGLVWAFAASGRVGPIEGAVLFSLLVLYLGWMVREELRRSAAPPDTPPPPPEAGPGEEPPSSPPADPSDVPPGTPLPDLVRVAGGLVLLVLGARWFLDGAVAIARALAVSELVIGLTLVAAGTSLPELAATAMAAWRGERDLAVGNVVGSNLFNLLGVLGLAAFLGGGVNVPAVALRVDLPLMVWSAVVCLPLCRSDYLLDRKEGALLVGTQAIYLGCLVARSRAPDFPQEAVLLVATGLVLVVALAPLVTSRAEERCDPPGPPIQDADRDAGTGEGTASGEAERAEGGSGPR